MELIKLFLWVVLGFASLVCWIVILIGAFKDAVWKGVVCLLCWLYWLYYALFEFKHESKWLIVILALFGGGLGAILRFR